MPHRKSLAVISIFHAVVNSLYLVRFFGVLPPEEIVHGYVPWFMSFALSNIVFTLLAWLLVYALFKKRDCLAVFTGLICAGGLIFHALIGFMFGFYTGYLLNLTWGTMFEIVVYAYGLLLAAFYCIHFYKFIAKNGGA